MNKIKGAAKVDAQRFGQPVKWTWESKEVLLHT